MYEGRKNHFKGRKPGVFVNFGSISMLLGPDPNPHSQYGSGSRTANDCRSMQTISRFTTLDTGAPFPVILIHV